MFKINYFGPEILIKVPGPTVFTHVYFKSKKIVLNRISDLTKKELEIPLFNMGHRSSVKQGVRDHLLNRDTKIALSNRCSP